MSWPFIDCSIFRCIPHTNNSLMSNIYTHDQFLKIIEKIEYVEAQYLIVN